MATQSRGLAALAVRVVGSLSGLAIIIGALVLIACGDGDNPEESPPPASARAVTHDDLAVMVLPQEQLGDLAHDLQRDSSDYNSASNLAIDTLDPDDTADDFETMGFIDGYALDFVDPNMNPFGADLPEVMSVGTSVDHWRDGEAAQRFLEHMVDDVRRFDGHQVDDTAINEFEEFTVDELGDAAGGIRFRIGFAGTDVSFVGTIVYFRLGSLAVAVSMTVSGEADFTAELVRIASDLETRIEGVLDGSVEMVP